jgi:hypothetical protein
LCAFLFLTTVSAFSQQKPRISLTAKEHFRAGLAHLDDPSGPKYEEAYREFKAAYTDSPSPDIAVNVGYCAFFLERDQEALEMYEIFLAHATERELPRQKRAQMQKDVQSLRTGLVQVSITAKPGSAALVDERVPTKGQKVVNRYPVENGQLKIGIHPGIHKLTLSADGFKPESWELDAPSGSLQSHEFSLSKLPDTQLVSPATLTPPAARDVPATTKTKSTHPLVYGGGIAAGAFAAGAVAAGLVANSKKGDFEEVNDGTRPEQARSLRGEMRTFSVLTDVCIGAAAVSAGVALYFYVSGDKTPAPPSTTSGLRIVPYAGTSRAGLAFTGKF